MLKNSNYLKKKRTITKAENSYYNGNYYSPIDCYNNNFYHYTTSITSTITTTTNDNNDNNIDNNKKK